MVCCHLVQVNVLLNVISKSQAMGYCNIWLLNQILSTISLGLLHDQDVIANGHLAQYAIYPSKLCETSPGIFHLLSSLHFTMEMLISLCSWNLICFLSHQSPLSHIGFRIDPKIILLNLFDYFWLKILISSMYFLILLFF